MLDIATISESVNNAAHEFPIKRVDLFGSYAEERQTEKSDVEFTSIAVSLLLLASLRDRLEKDLGTSVDIVHAPIPDGSILDVGKTVTLYEQ